MSAVRGEQSALVSHILFQIPHSHQKEKRKKNWDPLLLLTGDRQQFDSHCFFPLFRASIALLKTASILPDRTFNNFIVPTGFIQSRNVDMNGFWGPEIVKCSVEYLTRIVTPSCEFLHFPSLRSFQTMTKYICDITKQMDRWQGYGSYDASDYNAHARLSVSSFSAYFDVIKFAS